MPPRRSWRWGVLVGALAIDEKALGPDHPDVVTTLENMAELYIKMGRDNEAVPFLNRVRKIRLGL